jgi:cytochrome c553
MAQASITLLPPQAITMPIEVVGPVGNMESVTVPIPPGTNLSGTALWMQIHGLKYADKASVQVNNAPWVPIDDNTVTLLGQAKAYGGIGGGFTTFTMTLALPAGTLVPGNNTVSFQFTTPGGVGFRVLKLNFVQPDGTMLLPASLFQDDDPNTWQPPLTSAADIAQGQLIFQTASIIHAGAPVKAHCNNCHTQDGRDLHYFNYSNKFIHYGAILSGLTDHQADQVASYIRSLNVPNPGRPWNPPYQPGPGLDSQPVEQWAAGAGLDAVLDSDADLLNELFPTGVQSTFFSPTGNLNVRETRIPLQLLDWNSWLPPINPIDGWPDFLGSSFYNKYGQLRAALQAGGPAAYSTMGSAFDEWNGNYMAFMVPKVNGLPTSTWTPNYVKQVEGAAHWALVKTWELNQEFGLEGMARSVFSNPKADARAWRSEIPFLASPNMLHIPRGAAGLGNGLLDTWVYDAFTWYQAQLILDNSEYEQHGASPIDWGYSYAKVGDMSQNDSPPQAALFTLWQTKALQISNNGAGPDAGNGWNWLNVDISRLVTPSLRTIWTGIAPATRTAIHQGLVQGWLTEAQQFTPQQFWNYAGGSTISASQVPNHMSPDSPILVDRVWYMISRFKYFGVNQTQINQLAAWAQTIWPNGGWAADAAAICSADTSDSTIIRCNTDQ